MSLNLARLVGYLALPVVFTLSLRAADDPSRLPDPEFFSQLDLAKPGLEQVRAAVSAQNYPAAKTALVAYYRHRSGFDLATPEPKDTDISPLLAHRFTFFKNQTVAVDQPAGSGNVNWYSFPTTVDGNWYRQLVRFSYLETVVARDRYDRSAGHPDPAGVVNMLELVADYITDVANEKPGAGYGGPLQTAVRLHTWARCYPHLVRIPELDPNRLAGMLKHLWQMADFISREENFLGYTNNRGMLQTNALQYVATYYPEFKDAARWEELNERRISLYLANNIYPNGVLGEPTTHYHRSQTAAITQLFRVARKNGRDILPPAAEALVNRMFTYYGDVSLPNGQLFAVGDSSFSAEFPVMNKLAAALGREDLLYITSRGQSGAPPLHTSAMYGQGSAVMRNGWGPDAVVAFIENQPPGSHHHPDDLALSLYTCGEQVIANSGRQSYDPADMSGVWHAAETEANSTVQIDGRPQRSFGQRIDRWTTQPGFDFYRGHTSDARAAALAPTDDAYIDASDPEANFPNTPTLLVSNGEGTAADCMTYLKFRVGTVMELLGGATLRLYSQEPLDAPVTLQAYGLKNPAVALGDDDWNEHNLSWNHRSRGRAANDAMIASPEAVSLGTLEISKAGWYHLSTPALRDFIAAQAQGSGVVSIALVDELQQARRVTFQSRQSEHVPSLALELRDGQPWPEVIRHTRNIYFDRERLFIISDRLAGAEHRHRYEQLWNLNPSANPGFPQLDSAKGHVDVQFGHAPGEKIFLQLASADAFQLAGAQLKAGWMAKSQTGKVPNQRVAFTKIAAGPVNFDTAILVDHTAGTSPLTIEHLALEDRATDDGDIALRIHLDTAGGGDVVTYFLTANPGTLRRFAGFAFDGEMLAMRTDAGGRLKTIALQGGTRLRQGEVDLVRAAGVIHDVFIDLVSKPGPVLSSSQPLQQDLVLGFKDKTAVAISFNGRPVTCTVENHAVRLHAQRLFAAEFESGTTESWQLNNTGTWSIGDLTNRSVLETHAAETAQTALVGDGSWSDYAIETVLQFDTAPAQSGQIGLVARNRDSANGYRFVYDTETADLKIVRRSEGVDHTLGSTHRPLSPGAPYKLGATLSGRQLTLYLNDSPEVTAEDGMFSSGVAGLYQRRLLGFFDDVFVTSARGGTPIPIGRSFACDLIATANGYVGNHAPDTNVFDHFASPEFRARLPVVSDAQGRQRISYVQFDLGGIDGSGVQRATLRLYRTAEEIETSDPAGAVRVVGIPANAWNDRQLTWDNSPNHSADGAKPVGSDWVELSVIKPEQPGWYEIDVTSYVLARPGQRLFSFMLMAAAPGKTSVQFQSNVYPLKPVLRVEGRSARPTNKAE